MCTAVLFFLIGREILLSTFCESVFVYVLDLTQRELVNLTAALQPPRETKILHVMKDLRNSKPSGLKPFIMLHQDMCLLTCDQLAHH